MFFTSTCFSSDIGYLCPTDRPNETYSDKLRSIHAQLEYTHEVLRYDSIGVPFCTYIYVPETNPFTGVEFHEREDDAHVLKVN